MIWASQVAPGTKNGLRMRVAGEAGGLLWDQERPDDLEFTPVGEPTRILRRGGDCVTTSSRLPAGHPEGYLEAFATIYAEAAGQVRRFRDGTKTGRDTVLPTVSDGLAGMRFIAAGVRSSEKGGIWVGL
jgi:predicted dehydrogenase